MPGGAPSCNAGLACSARQERPSLSSAEGLTQEQLTFEAEIDLTYMGGNGDSRHKGAHCVREAAHSATSNFFVQLRRFDDARQGHVGAATPPSGAGVNDQSRSERSQGQLQFFRQQIELNL
jgi:hypothetical protein